MGDGYVLEAEGLSKRYGRGRLALDNITLRLASGGVVGLVGPNGAGKSTLMKCWFGFERPTRGRTSVMGLNPWKQRGEVVSRCSYIPQSPALYRDLRVADHLDFVTHYRGKGFDRALATKRLQDLGIPLDAAAGTLSGGQAAQAGLAIALGLHAEVLLLDEPLASLDPLARREFIEVLIDDTHRTGATAVMSSHVVTDVELACSRLVVLGVGRVLVEGSVADLLAQHSARADDAAIEGRVAPLPGHRALYRHVAPTETSSPATLDDVVLGYLSAGRAL